MATISETGKSREVQIFKKTGRITKCFRTMREALSFAKLAEGKLDSGEVALPTRHSMAVRGLHLDQGCTEQAA